MNKPEKLLKIKDAFNTARVLCCGDIMLDRFVYGTVNRISPEAPIPVLSIDRETNMLGGAGNVVRNVAALGGTPVLNTVVGDDPAGATIKELLKDGGVSSSDMITVRNRTTAIKTRYLAGNHQLLRADNEVLKNIEKATVKKVIASVKKAMKTCGSLVISDYGKGVLVPGVIAGIIDAAHRAGKPVIVDPKGSDYGRYQGADLVTPNKAELAEAVGHALNADCDIIDAARSLVMQYDLGAVLVTRSHEGMSLITSEGDVTHLSAEAREVFDVSGAGDTVVAAIATAMAAGATLIDAITISNICAGVVVGKSGTAACYASELSSAINHQSLSDTESKIHELEPLLNQVRQWRDAGITVGFTNGCFDLLHMGHISLLKQSAQACDRLIVGLNSDTSVTQLKGPDRPIQSEMARATILAALSDVAGVVIFDDETPFNLINAIKPDVLIKGADYKVEDVVGADIVQGWGGKVVLVDLIEGHSTTSMVARIAK